MPSAEAESETDRTRIFVRFFVEWVASLGVFALVVAAATLISLAGSLIVGYLPYSDRPGPGWGRGVFNWSEFEFFLDWMLFLPYFLLQTDVALFPLARLLGWFHSPRWLLRVFGGVFAGIAALVGVAAAGWYIAIAEFPAVCGAVSGLIYGAVILPRFAGPARSSPATWRQWTGAIATILACGAFVVYPLIPIDQPNLDLGVEVVVARVIAGPGDLTTQTMAGLNQDELKFLKSLGFRGTLHLDAQGGRFNPAVKHGKAVIVLTRHLNSRAEFRQPSEEHVIYVQQGGRWRMYPSDATTSHKKIRLSPSSGDFVDFEVE